MKRLISLVLVCWMPSYGATALGQHGKVSIAGTTTGTVTLTATTAGSTIMAIPFNQDTVDRFTAATSVKDGASNNYTKMSGVCGFTTDGSFFSVNGFYLANAPSTTSVIFTGSANLVNGGGYAFEITGADTTAPLDQCITNTNNASTSTDGETSTAKTTTAAGEFVAGGNMHFGAPSAAGTGFTEIDTSVGNCQCEAEYQIQTSAGSIAATWTGANTTLTYLAIMATFKAASAGALPPVIRRPVWANSRWFNSPWFKNWIPAA